MREILPAGKRHPAPAAFCIVSHLFLCLEHQQKSTPNLWRKCNGGSKCLLSQRNRTAESNTLWKILAENCWSRKKNVREINNNNNVNVGKFYWENKRREVVGKGWL